MIDYAPTTLRNKNLSRRKRSELLLRRLAKHLGINVQLKSSEIGRSLERRVARICVDLGFQVIDRASCQLKYDLLINGNKVQCKSRRMYRSRKLHGHGVMLHKGKSAYAHASEIDFLVIKHASLIYVIPTSVLGLKDGWIKSWVPLSDKFHFINAWGQLAGQPVKCDRQIGFDFQGGTDGTRS